MEYTHTQTARRENDLTAFANSRLVSDETQARLDTLLRANEEIARQKAMFSSEREWLEAETMQNPIDTEKAYSYFGLMLGMLPPAAFILRVTIDSRIFQSDGVWLVPLFLFMNAISAIVGFFSGKFIGKAARQIETYRWWRMVTVAPFLGLLWGMIAGGSGGVILFIIGAFFGAVIGGIVGAAALPMFAVLHRLMKKGDVIEYRQFLPLALGITLTICSFILGM